MSEVVSRITKGLNGIDFDKVLTHLNKYGIYDTARILGFDISDYNNSLAAGRLAIEYQKQQAPKTILEYVEVLAPRLSDAVRNFILKHHVELQKALDDTDDLNYDHDWFSANTMITMYSLKLKYNTPSLETPNQVWMRIAIEFYHKVSLERVLRAYREMAEGWYTPASPTIFNAGTKKCQMASCFLVSIPDDLKGMYKQIYRAAMVSKGGGGLGFDLSEVRHSEISFTGISQGIIPLMQCINSAVRHVNQGGTRKGAATCFLRTHHIGVEEFIDAVKTKGERYTQVHDINTCLWTSWLFWERVRQNGDWTLFCPAIVPHLNKLYGVEFAKAYIAAENDNSIPARYKKVIKARDLHNRIKEVQKETGMPYLMSACSSNLKSNHRHVGYIRCSNLCLEIIEYTDENNIASCNLSSLSARMFARGKLDKNLPVEEAARKAIDFEQLGKITSNVLENLNAVIDNNMYALDKTKDGKFIPGIIHKTNKKQRPVGIGMSGFADFLHILDLPFEDAAVSMVNKMVFACIYWNALAHSVQLAILNGKCAYFDGSPMAEGKLQFDLWAEEYRVLKANEDLFGKVTLRKEEDDLPVDPYVWSQKPKALHNADGKIIDVIEPTWNDLKRAIKEYGTANSLLIALMPTASTAQIRRNCESVEAHQNNMYSRQVLKASYPVLNRYLVEDCKKLEIWNKYTVEYIKINNGSIAKLTEFVKNNPNKYPSFTGDYERLAFMEKKYKTMWEIPQRTFLKLAAERGRYVDQSASSNLYLKDCDDKKLDASHSYAVGLGLKTYMYYLRQKGGETIKFTADDSLLETVNQHLDIKVENAKPKPSCIDENGVCVACT